MEQRSPRQVLEDHLSRRAKGDLDGDLANNYSDDIVLLCRDGVFRGCTAIRASARRLGLQLPGAEFTYVSCQVEGSYGYLE